MYFCQHCSVRGVLFDPSPPSNKIDFNFLSISADFSLHPSFDRDTN